MKFTKDVEYAFISLLAIGNSEMPLSAKAIAGENRLSFEMLSKVLQHLCAAGYVNSIKGPKGGYVLKKNLKDISLGGIVGLFKGSNAVVDCASGNKKCGNEQCCSIKTGMHSIQAMWDRLLAKVSLEELA